MYFLFFCRTLSSSRAPPTIRCILANSQHSHIHLRANICWYTIGRAARNKQTKNRKRKKKSQKISTAQPKREERIDEHEEPFK